MQPDAAGSGRYGRDGSSSRALRHKSVVDRDGIHPPGPDHQGIWRSGGAEIAVPATPDNEAQIVAGGKADGSRDIRGAFGGHHESAGRRPPSIQKAGILRQRRVVAEVEGSRSNLCTAGLSKSGSVTGASIPPAAPFNSAQSASLGQPGMPGRTRLTGAPLAGGERNEDEPASARLVPRIWRRFIDIPYRGGADQDQSALTIVIRAGLVSGRIGTMTHDYRRNGTNPLFAAATKRSNRSIRRLPGSTRRRSRRSDPASPPGSAGAGQNTAYRRWPAVRRRPRAGAGSRRDRLPR
jgi:hypothetical protein